MPFLKILFLESGNSPKIQLLLSLFPSPETREQGELKGESVARAAWKLLGTRMLMGPGLGIRDQQDSALEASDGGSGVGCGVTGLVGPTASQSG